MTQKPSSNNTEQTTPRPFWLSLTMIVATISFIALVPGFILQSVELVSNIFFLAAFVLWIIAVVPIFTEVGGNAKLTMQARKEGSSAKELIKEQEEKGKYSRGTRITYLYGLSGFLCFMFAFLSLAL